MKTIYYISAIYILLLNCITDTLSAQDRSFIQQEVIKVEGIRTDSQITKLNAAQKQVKRTYLDGLGRPIQEVDVKTSPSQKDIISFSMYDNLGRQTTSYLPYAGTDGSGNFHQAVITEQAAFYANGTTDKVADDNHPYSQQVFENSPLQKVITTGGIGEGYQLSEHSSVTSYRTNLSTEIVRRWNPDESAGTNYSAGTLSVIIMTDAGGNQTIAYQDKSGKTVLKKQQLDGTISGISVPWLETYYVYDDLGQLRYVVPPKAVAVMESAGNYSLSQSALDKLLFRYSYDNKGREVERTVPGGAVIYMIYDPLDRLPPIPHDKQYDVLGAKGVSSLLTDTRTIGADWQFVSEELQIAISPYVNTMDRIDATMYGLGLGIMALPKTLVQSSTQVGRDEISLWYHISKSGIRNK